MALVKQALRASRLCPSQPNVSRCRVGGRVCRRGGTGRDVGARGRGNVTGGRGGGGHGGDRGGGGDDCGGGVRVGDVGGDVVVRWWLLWSSPWVTRTKHVWENPGQYNHTTILKKTIDYNNIITDAHTSRLIRP